MYLPDHNDVPFLLVFHIPEWLALHWHRTENGHIFWAGIEQQILKVCLFETGSYVTQTGFKLIKLGKSANLWSYPHLLSVGIREVPHAQQMPYTTPRKTSICGFPLWIHVNHQVLYLISCFRKGMLTHWVIYCLIVVITMVSNYNCLFNNIHNKFTVNWGCFLKLWGRYH